MGRSWIRLNFLSKPLHQLFCSLISSKMNNDRNTKSVSGSIQTKHRKHIKKSTGNNSGQGTYVNRHSTTKKKQMRDDKYKSGHGNKAEGHGFAEQKKMKMVHQYRRLLTKQRKKEVATGSQSISYSQPPHDDNGTVKENKKKFIKTNPYHNAVQHAQNIQSNKQKKWEEIKQKKEEQEMALKQYKQRKNKKHKMMAKKTFRGQPSMASRMDLLLQQIQENYT